MECGKIVVIIISGDYQAIYILSTLKKSTFDNKNLKIMGLIDNYNYTMVQ